MKSDVPQQQTQQKLVGASKDLWDSYQKILIAQNSCRALSRKEGISEAEKTMWKARFDSLGVELNKTQIAIDANTIGLMKQLPDDEVWMKGLKLMANSVLYMEGYPYKKEIVSLFNSLPDSRKQSAVGKDVRAILFPPEVAEAGKQYSPALIANYTYDLVKEYNQFYHDFSILRESDAEVKAFRLLLSAQVARVVRTAMSLLGIQVPDRM